MPLFISGVEGSNHGNGKLKSRKKTFTLNMGFYGVWQEHGETVGPPHKSCHVAGVKMEKILK